MVNFFLYYNAFLQLFLIVKCDFACYIIWYIKSVENSSPVPCNECKEHLQQIETLQSEVTKCNSEIKELKVLLRLSPPESMANNSRKDPSQAIPEPTEFEYLKNIIYEYMMGKEPV
ncbi:hypothetical protein AVEN_195451-1, partial [Araneus ventricosus]